MVKPGKQITVSRADVFAYANEVPVLIATLLATMITQAEQKN